MCSKSENAVETLLSAMLSSSVARFDLFICDLRAQKDCSVDVGERIARGALRRDRAGIASALVIEARRSAVRNRGASEASVAVDERRRLGIAERASGIVAVRIGEVRLLPVCDNDLHRHDGMAIDALF